MQLESNRAAPVNIPTISFDATPQAQALIGQIDAAHTAALAQATTWLSANPHATQADLTSFITSTTPAYPDAAGTSAELDTLHGLVPTRTAADDALAGTYGTIGRKQLWKALAKGTGIAGLNDASKGALAVTKAIVPALKTHFERPRPYTVDPTLDAERDAQDDPSASYPSSHAASAYAGATVLALTDPSDGAGFLHYAQQVAFSRLYAAVHFPSDVLQGVRVGTIIGAWAAAHPDLAAAAAQAAKTEAVTPSPGPTTAT